MNEKPIEGAFLACSLWLADADGWPARSPGQALFDRAVAVANDLGLLAEDRFRRRAIKPEISRKP